MKHVITRAAREDILRQFQYYLIEADDERIAERFLEASQATLQQVCNHPEIGGPRAMKNPKLVGLRSWHVKGFPDIRVYYLVSEGALRIVRVLHGKRDIQAILEADE